MLNLLEILVGFAARSAAAQIPTPDDRKAFESSLARLLEFGNQSDSLGLIRARNSFYRALVRIGGNAELARVLPKTQVHIVRVQFRSFSTASEARRFRDYREIATAVLAADPRRAELAARRHVRGIRLDIASLPDDAFARAESPATNRSRE